VTNATHTGDVTGSGALTIANGAVTLAKMGNVGTGTVFYRASAGTGPPEIQTLAVLKTALGLTGTNSGDQTTITGNAGTATILLNSRTINGVSFNGSANITIPSNITPGTVGNHMVSNGTVWTSEAPPDTVSIGGINEQTGTTYTLALTDNMGWIRCTNANAITVTIPLHATIALPLKSTINIVQGGAGQVTIAPVSGSVTIESYLGALSLKGQYAGLTLYQRATNVWVLIGNIE